MDKITRYIHVAKTNKETRHPWELLFKGGDFQELALLVDEDMLRFRTGHQALMLALRLQNMTPATAIIVDPDLDVGDKRIPDEQELQELHEMNKELVDA